MTAHLAIPALAVPAPTLLAAWCAREAAPDESPERDVQVNAFRWCHYDRGLLCLHVPNELLGRAGKPSKRDYKRASSLKAQGFLPGAPDLLILEPPTNPAYAHHHSVWLELKAGGLDASAMTDEQRRQLARARSKGLLADCLSGSAQVRLYLEWLFVRQGVPA